MKRSAALVLSALVVVSSCNRSKKTEVVPSSEKPDASPEPSEVPSEPPLPPIEVGPAGEARSRTEREQAVWAIIGGVPNPRRLPQLGTDPGKTLDPSLRERLAPRTRSVDPSNASRVIAGMRAGFRACYQRAGSLSAEGTVHLVITVAPNGVVTNVKTTAEGSLPPAVVSCIKERATSAQFEAQGKTVELKVPVKLSRK